MRTMLCVALAALATTRAAAVTLGQVDDFQSGTLQGWQAQASLTNVATGGPAGSGDRFLRIQRLTAGNLGANNTAQWTGNYAAAGVARLRFHLNNFGPNPLALRVSIFGVGTFTTTNEVVLPPGSGWVPVEFSLDASALTLTSGSGTLAQTLSNVGTLLIRHDPDPISPNGEPNPVIGTLGVDNITALPPVPPVPLLPDWAPPLATALILLLALRTSALSCGAARS
jgi:hypothetical protein